MTCSSDALIAFTFLAGVAVGVSFLAVVLVAAAVVHALTHRRTTGRITHE